MDYHQILLIAQFNWWIFLHNMKAVKRLQFQSHNHKFYLINRKVLVQNKIENKFFVNKLFHICKVYLIGTSFQIVGLYRLIITRIFKLKNKLNKKLWKMESQVKVWQIYLLMIIVKMILWRIHFCKGRICKLAEDFQARYGMHCILQIRLIWLIQKDMDLQIINRKMMDKLQPEKKTNKFQN